MFNIELGKIGEKIAADFLMNKNYTILTKNYRTGKLELDIIAMDRKELVVIEVKTRNSIEFGEPWEAVTLKKQKQIIKATNQYILESNCNLHVRFDVISIILSSQNEKINHIIDAFTP